MPNPTDLSVRERVALALRVLRGEGTRQPAADAARAVIPVTYPNWPGMGGAPGQAQMSLVRTANPQEYKPDGAAIRNIGFTRHPVVHACMRVISDVVASVPLIVLRERGEYESRVGEQHPLQRLLDYPGPRFTARSMRARLAIDFLGYGNALLLMERGPTGQGLPRGLRSINPESLQSVWVDTEGDPRRYDYADWSGIVRYADVADVIHVRDLEMPRPFAPDAFGFPRGATALASIAADNEATNYVRQVVTNDGTPTFAVLLADEATQDDASAMQDRYRARVVDRGKRGTPAFFGAVRDIKPLGFTLSDLEFPDLRRVSREDICAAFGVDPRMIGIASASNDSGLSGAQYVEARARLVQHTIEPMMAAIEDELNHWLAPEFGNVWISYDHDMLRDLVEDDAATSTRVRAEFAASLRTWEESRRALKLSPVPEPTDTIQMGAGSQLVPAAVAVIDPRSVLEQAPAQDGQTPPAPVPVVEVETDDDADEPEDDAENAEDEGRADDAQGRPYWWHHPEVLDKKPKRTAYELMDATQEEREADPRYQFWKRSVDELDKREIDYYRIARRRFSEDKAAVAAMFSAATRQDPILDEITRRIEANYRPGGEWHAAWREAYLALTRKMYLFGAQQVGGAGFSFQLVSPDVLKAIEDRAGLLATYIGETTTKQVLAAVRAGELGGLSIAEISRLIQATAYGEAMTDNRATTIARTESAGAMSQGSWDQAQAMGDLYRYKEWLAFEDAKTRETHLACMAQGRIPIDQTFSNGLAYPLEPGSPVSEAANCRCVLGYMTDAVDPD